MTTAGTDVVTGAFSYSGKYITRLLLESGRSVRTLTGHPDRPDPFGRRVPADRYDFDDPDALAHGLEGVDTLYNTYWVRFIKRGVTFDQAVHNSTLLFDAGRRAGVRRIVHVSIANPSLDSPLAYYRGKALVERSLAGCGVEYAIVRPTVLFGHEDVLVNNIAWFLRRLHMFTIPGSGDYPIQPVHVEDLARLCVESAAAPTGTLVNAAGPETFSFEQLVLDIREAIGARALVTHAPPVVALAGTKLLGLVVRDVVLTDEEIKGLTRGLLACEGPAAGRITFSQWLTGCAESLGSSYANELQRHFLAA